MKCEKCGEEVEIGAWPFCPHGETRFHVDAFEPYYDEHLSTDGEWITSSRQRQKIMDRNGIDVKTDNPHRSRIARGATGQALFFDMGKR